MRAYVVLLNNNLSIFLRFFYVYGGIHLVRVFSAMYEIKLADTMPRT
jgi:hypothetical protein